MSDTNARDTQDVREHRREERVPVTIPATLTLEDRQYSGVVLNLSSGGLLLSLDRQPGLQIPENAAGKSASVTFGNEDESKRSVHGTIVRVLLDGNVAVVALSMIRNAGQEER